jgi:hypothetical protein
MTAINLQVKTALLLLFSVVGGTAFGQSPQLNPDLRSPRPGNLQDRPTSEGCLWVGEVSRKILEAFKRDFEADGHSSEWSLIGLMEETNHNISDVASALDILIKNGFIKRQSQTILRWNPDGPVEEAHWELDQLGFYYIGRCL